MNDFQDLMDQYAEERKERERYFAELWRRIDEDEAPLLVELEQAGLSLGSIDEIISRGILLDPPIVDILLRSLKTLQIDNNRDMVVRALILAKEPFDGRPLIECFENDSPPHLLRWTIGNTMACARITGIADWLVPAIQNRDYGKGREMLTMAIAKHVPRAVACKVLLSVIDELPTHVAWALGRIGGSEELRVLKQRLGTSPDLPAKRFESAIRQIERRLEKQAKRKK